MSTSLFIGAGYGLFAERTFKKGEFIVPYEGVVLETLDPNKNYTHAVGHIYCPRGDGSRCWKQVTIDAPCWDEETPKHWFAHMINNPRFEGKKARTETGTVPKENVKLTNCGWLQATEHIQDGMELFTFY